MGVRDQRQIDARLQREVYGPLQRSGFDWCSDSRGLKRFGEAVGFVYDVQAPNASHGRVLRHLEVEIHVLLQTLTCRERWVMERRTGVWSGEIALLWIDGSSVERDRELATIAEELSITEAQCRKLYDSAVRKLRGRLATTTSELFRSTRPA